MTFDVNTFDVKRFDDILKRGLSHGVGQRNGQMCIEAAICTVLNLPHGDDPGCVSKSVRSFKIVLNDKRWSSPEARARGLRDLGLAQLGSLGMVDDKQFVTILSKKIIQTLLPAFIKKLYPTRKDLLEAADVCEKAGTREAAIKLKKLSDDAAAAAVADAAAYAADAAAATGAAAYAAYAAYATDAAAVAVADAAAYAADAAAATGAAAYAAYADADADIATRDEFLLLGAKLALDTLKELNSPGCSLLARE
jgi:hypothetical protein